MFSYWLNYDGEIGKDKIEDFDKLYDGTIITNKDRTFIEACNEYGWYNLANDLTKRNSLKKIKKVY